MADEDKRGDTAPGFASGSAKSQPKVRDPDAGTSSDPSKNGRKSAASKSQAATTGAPGTATPRTGSGNDERGFASMDGAKQREIASKGGSASGGNFKNDPARAAEAGRKGGQASHGSGNQGGRNNNR